MRGRSFGDEHETGIHGVAQAIVERDNECVQLCVQPFAPGGERARQRRWREVCLLVFESGVRGGQWCD